MQIIVVVLLMCSCVFPAAVSFSSGVFGHGTGKIVLYGVSCSESLSRLQLQSGARLQLWRVQSQ